MKSKFIVFEKKKKSNLHIVQANTLLRPFIFIGKTRVGQSYSVFIVIGIVLQCSSFHSFHSFPLKINNYSIPSELMSPHYALPLQAMMHHHGNNDAASIQGPFFHFRYCKKLTSFFALRLL